MTTPDSSKLVEHIRAYVRKIAPNLPPDAEIFISAPNDGRFWVDVLSPQHAADPVMDQYVLVSVNLMNKLSADLFDAMADRQPGR